MRFLYNFRIDKDDNVKMFNMVNVSTYVHSMNIIRIYTVRHYSYFAKVRGLFLTIVVNLVVSVVIWRIIACVRLFFLKNTTSIDI